MFFRHCFITKIYANFIFKNRNFQFLTINNADERAHLVPVLNIILKLSPDENRTLQSVARGNDGGQSGWSNLLPTW